MTDSYVETYLDLEEAIARWRRRIYADGMALHHINGNAHDNRPENLTLVRVK